MTQEHQLFWGFYSVSKVILNSFQVGSEFVENVVDSGSEPPVNRMSGTILHKKRDTFNEHELKY